MITEITVTEKNDNEIVKKDINDIDLSKGFYVYRSKTTTGPSKYVVCILRKIQTPFGFELGFVPIDNTTIEHSRYSTSSLGSGYCIRTAIQCKRRVYRFDTLEELYKAMGDQKIQ